MRKLYVVELRDAERQQLEELTRRGRNGARKIRRARTLLLAERGHTDEPIATAVGTHITTVERTRQRFVEEGLPEALSEKPRPGKARKLDGRQEAHLLALACTEPPGGRKRWTMQLLADRMVALGITDTISDETVRRARKRGT